MAKEQLHERIEHELTLHPPTSEQAQRMDKVRAQAKAFAHLVVELCPEGRELSLFLTEVDSALRWAIASIAREPRAKEHHDGA